MSTSGRIFPILPRDFRFSVRRANFALYIPMQLDLVAHDKNVSDKKKSNKSELQNCSFTIIVKHFLPNIFP